MAITLKSMRRNEGIVNIDNQKNHKIIIFVAKHQ